MTAAVAAAGEGSGEVRALGGQSYPRGSSPCARPPCPCPKAGCRLQRPQQLARRDQSWGAGALWVISDPAGGGLALGVSDGRGTAGCAPQGPLAWRLILVRDAPKV
jgi:hypothetical protein